MPLDGRRRCCGREHSCRRAAAVLCVVFACLSCWWAASCTARELIIPLSIAGEALAVRYEPEDLVDSAFSRFVRETPWPLTRDSLASQARRAFQAAVMERRCPLMRLRISCPGTLNMALIHDVYQGDDEESILSSLLQCGSTDAASLNLAPLAPPRVAPVLTLDAAGSEPGTFRLWEGERLHEAMTAFVPWAEVTSLDELDAATKRAEDRLRLVSRRNRDLVPYLWRMPARTHPVGFEPDQAFPLRRNVKISSSDASRGRADRDAQGKPAWEAESGIVLQLSMAFCNRHYYHIVECLLGLYAWSREHRMGGDPVEVVVVDDDIRTPTHDFLTAALFPGARVEIRRPGHLFSAIVSDKAALSENIPRSLINTQRALEHSAVVESFWFPEFLAAVHAAAGASPRPRPASPGEVRAVYVRRAMSLRELGDEDLARLASVMLEEHGVALEVVRFEAMTVEEQVRLSAGVDLMVGVHGNGLTNLLWMPPHGAVLELFAADWHFYDYQMLSEISGHLYSGVQEGNPRPYHRGSRRESAYGMQIFGPTSLDWTLLGDGITYLLAHVLAK